MMTSLIRVVMIVLKHQYQNDVDCLPGAWEIVRDYCGEKHLYIDCGDFRTVPLLTWSKEQIGDLMLWLQ